MDVTTVESLRSLRRKPVPNSNNETSRQEFDLGQPAFNDNEHESHAPLIRDGSRNHQDCRCQPLAEVNEDRSGPQPIPADEHDNGNSREESMADTLLIPASSNTSFSGVKVTKRQLPWLVALTFWWQEVFAIVLLLAATIASFATVYPYQDKPLPDWPYLITIGALLSLYSVLLRLAASFLIAESLSRLMWRWFQRGEKPIHDLVLHDGATRGPIGAMSLLWRLPLPLTWQWLGCTLLLVALAVGPLTQLVLVYEQCSVIAEIQDASIARTGVFLGRGVHQGALTHSLTADEQASILAGVYSTGAARHTCASGNCTFAPYTSIGFCSTCDDVSNLTYTERQVVTWTEADGNNGPRNSSRTNATLVIPDGISTSLIYGSPYHDYLGAELAGSWATFATAGRGNNATAGRAARQTFQILMGVPDHTNYDFISGGSRDGCKDAPSTEWRCRGWASAQCSIFPCTRTYTANITNGSFEERVLESGSLAWGSGSGEGYWYHGGVVSSTLDTACINNEEKSSLRDLGYTIDASTRWIAYNLTGGRNRTFNWDVPIPRERALIEQGFVDRGCIYAMDIEFLYGLNMVLEPILGGILWARLNTYYATATAFSGPQLLQSVFNFGNFSLQRTQEIFENISLSMTNYVRNNPGNASWVGNSVNPGNYYNISLNGRPTAPATGTTLTMKTCLRVRWAWLTFPVAVTVLTLIFFVGVMLTTHRLPADVRTWKSSPLPLLCNGSSTMDESGKVSQQIHKLNSASKHIKMSLVRDEYGISTLRKREIGTKESERMLI